VSKCKALRLRAKEHTEVCDWARASTGSATIESNVVAERSRSAAVGHLWNTAEFGRFSCLNANFSSKAGAVLIFFCFVFLVWLSIEFNVRLCVGRFDFCEAWVDFFVFFSALAKQAFSLSFGLSVGLLMYLL